MSYSIDLRERVIIFIKQGNSKASASRIFSISRPTIDKWLSHLAKTGTLGDPPPTRGWKKLDPKKLQAYVNHHPDLTLAEYAQAFGASGPSVCLAFKRLKITRKKRPRSIKSETR